MITRYTFIRRIHRWGIKTDSILSPGDAIEVVTMKGKIIKRIVKKMIWTGKEDVCNENIVVYVWSIKATRGLKVCPHCGKSLTLMPELSSKRKQKPKPKPKSEETFKPEPHIPPSNGDMFF